MLRAVDGVPPELPPIEAVRIAVEAMAHLMSGRRSMARERQRLVAAHADLQERELIKRATFTAALARALELRGASEPEASLAADMGMAVFYVGFGRWVDDPNDREFGEIVREGFDQLKAVASGR
jgi:hypothetical protein